MRETDDSKHAWQDGGEQDHDAICLRHERHEPLAQAAARKSQAPIADTAKPMTARPGPVPGHTAPLPQQQKHRKFAGMCISEIDGTLQVSGSLACCQCSAGLIAPIMLGC